MAQNRRGGGVKLTYARGVLVEIWRGVDRLWRPGGQAVVEKYQGGGAGSPTASIRQKFVRGRGARRLDGQQLLALSGEEKKRRVGAYLGAPRGEEEEGGSDRCDVVVGAVGASAGSDTGTEEATIGRAQSYRLNGRLGRCAGRLTCGIPSIAT
jgi:hypothetical protein